MKYLAPIDLTLNELQNAKLQNLGSDPTPAGTSKGYVWFNTASGLAKVWDGTAISNLTNILESVAGSGAIQVAAVTAKSQTISILAASAGQAGTMSSTHYSLLAGATNANTASTLVQRDASGNFTAGTITASLTGTASNASALGNQTLAQVRDFSQTTGQRTATSAISDFDTQVRTSRLDQFAAPTAPVAFGGQRLTGVADPTASQDAATKNYVDSVATGLDVKASVRLASTANVAGTYSATGGTSGRGQFTNMPNAVDGTNVAVGNRVLLKNQSTPAQNGIWVVSTVGTGANGIWDRATDFDQDSEVTSGAFTFVEEGTQAGSGWVLTTANPIVIGGGSGSSLTFGQFSGGQAYTAGNGLLLTGNSFSVVGTANRISVSGSGVDISSSYVGQASITTLGTIGTGTWQGTAVGLAYGGTGSTTAAGAKTNLGFTTKYAQDLSTSATSYTINHNMNTLDVLVTVYSLGTFEVVYCNVVNSGVNSVQLSFTTAPAAGAYRVVVIG